MITMMKKKCIFLLVAMLGMTLQSTAQSRQTPNIQKFVKVTYLR